MSYRIHLTAAVGDYDIHQGLIQGSVTPDGINLTVLPLRSQERHWRMMRHDEFDVSELSFGSYMIIRGHKRKPWIAIPVFPHRRFRHSYIFVNPSKGINEPKDLEGKRVGIRTWQTTMGIWVRGILQDEYGVDFRKIHWFAQDPEDLPIEHPPFITIERVPEGTDVDEMLLRGELDALIYPDLTRSFLAGDPRIQRLFRNYKEEEMNYFRKTGLFPIMHTVVIREDILADNPWVAVNIKKAFEESKRLAFSRMEDPRKISLAWVRETIEEQRQVLGYDPYPCNVEDNRKNLETLLRYSYEQGMIPEPMSVDSLFFHATLDESPKYV